MIVEIPAVLRNALIPLFANHRRDRVFIDCVLEGRYGTAWADGVDAPTVARIDCGPFTALAGDASSVRAGEIVRLNPIEWVTPEGDEWTRHLELEFAGRIRVVPFTVCASGSLDVDHLRQIAERTPPGYAVRRLDASLVDRLFADLDKGWLVDSYGSVDEYLRRGIGYVAVRDGRVVCGAASAASSARAIDIDIETAPADRRRGLATVVGASLAIECLMRGVEPQWLAANDASCRVAERLGYTRGETYETFEIVS